MDDISRETGYWKWIYHITRLWNPPERVDVGGRDRPVNAKIIGFAVILSTFGNHGKSIRPCAATLSKRACLPRRECGNLRQTCIRLGLFRETGKSWNGIPELEITIPADRPQVNGNTVSNGIAPRGGRDDKKPQVGSNIVSNDIARDADPWADDPAPYRPPGMPAGELRPPEPAKAERRQADDDDDDDDESPAYLTDASTGKRVKATAATPAVRRRPWD